MKKRISFLLAILIGLSMIILPLSANADSAQVYQGSSIAALAKKQYGKPYQRGTQGPKTFDCVGLVCYVFKQSKIKIPFTTSAFNADRLSEIGVRVERKDLKPGDVVCFGSASNVTHVGIYVGNGIMINAMNANAGVKYCFIDQKAYKANSAKNTSSGKTVKIDGKSYTLGYFTKTFCYGVRIYGEALQAVVKNPENCAFTGKPVCPAVTVTFASAVLKEGVDYTVAYANNVKPGTARAVITGKGHYKGVCTEAEFEIKEGAAQAMAETIALSNAILPSGKLQKGRAFTIGGLLTANVPIRWVQFDVFDRDGAFVFGSDARPEWQSLSLYVMDHELHFSKLPEGTYTYRLTACTDHAEQTWENTFRVVQSDVTGSGMNYPSGTLQKGSAFSVKGTVKSAAAIKKVTVSVYGTDGEKRFEASVNPNAKTFDVHKLDAQMTFRKLPKGSYVYRVAVTDRNGTVCYLISHSFTVR